MSYTEERIKYLAVKAWKNDRTKDVYKALNCPNRDCDSFEWGGEVHPEMRMPGGGHDLGGMICVLLCHDCGHEFYNVPDEVIDSFLDRI